MAAQAKANQMFVNLPVKDLNRSIEFFTKVGFEFNAQFTDETATCMVIGDNLYAMLLVEEKFKSFTNKAIPDTSANAASLVALSVNSREEADGIANRALDAGGKPTNDPADYGFMYTRSFQDLDGHHWEVFHMDPSAVQGQ